MKELFFHQKNPISIPVPGTILVQEHFGKSANQNTNVSIAHLIVPGGWSEPYQTPEFDEYTIMIRGKKILEVNGEKITVAAGESILISKGTRVQYSNPFPEEAEFWAICTPAFSIDLANRESF
jgi:mannose-6-phosphate isomerase-like protein (cupin superfamily)